MNNSSMFTAAKGMKPVPETAEQALATTKRLQALLKLALKLQKLGLDKPQRKSPNRG
jgi:hypothetical protein